MRNEQIYIVISHWRRFQYYKNRNPPWIKNMTQLLHDDNYLSLPPGTRAVLHGLWLEYASSNARLVLDTASLSARLRLRVTKQQLERLRQGGFIEYAQTPRIQHVVTSRARDRGRDREELKAEDQRLDVEPLATWSYPQDDDEEHFFDVDKIKFTPKEMP